MKSILFLTKSESASSTRYRALQFMPSLREAGFEVAHARISGGVGTAILLALGRAARADIVVVLRKTLPRPLLWLLRGVSRRLVFDFDDAIFCNTDGSPSATRMRRFAAMLAACDQIFAGNDFLATHARRFNARVTVLPTCLDSARYQLAAPKPADSIDLVWIGSTSTRKYLLEVLPALRRAAGRVPNLRLKVIADFALPDAGIPVLAIPWNEAGEARELASSHIGIAPLRDDDWCRGKCALKLLQYMAVGLPVISSAVGANAEVVDSGRNGFLVSGDDEWCERIVDLARDAARRESMGEAGRERAQAGYSLAAMSLRMQTAFAQLP